MPQSCDYVLTEIATAEHRSIGPLAGERQISAKIAENEKTRARMSGPIGTRVEEINEMNVI